MLNTNYCYFQSQKFTRGATNKDLGLLRMVKIKVILPPLKLQEKFAKLAKEINVISIKQEVKLSKITELYNNLLIQAFTGKLTKFFRKKEESVISTQALFRDEILKAKSKASTVIESKQTVEPLQRIDLFLSSKQQKLLNSFENSEYILPENDFENLNVPSNQIQRNLDLLAEIGLIKSVNIAIAPGETGNIFYTPAYRSLTDNDNTKEADLESLEKETKL